MNQQLRSTRIRTTVLLLVIALLLLASPLNRIWFHYESPWFSIFIVWGIVIVFSLIINHQFDRNDHQ